MPIGAILGGVAAAASAASAIKGLTSGPSQSQINAAGQQAADYRQQAYNLWKDLNLPDFNTTPYQGQTWLQNYAPETYDPYTGQVYLPGNDQGDLAAQQQALAQLQGLSKPGLLPSDLVQLGQIQRAQAGAASSNSQAAADALRQRGLGGAGAEYAATLAANQNAANNTSNLYDTALQTALQRQLQATTAAGNQSNTMQNQAMTLSQNMANANNQFNTEVQNLRTNAAQNAANVRNQAQLYNQQGQQGVANTNVATANQNLDRNNQFLQQNYNNMNTKLVGETNALNGQATQANAQQAALGQQAAGATAQFNNGLTGLSNLFNSSGNNNSNSNSNNNSWMQQLQNWWNGSGSNNSSGGIPISGNDYLSSSGSGLG